MTVDDIFMQKADALVVERFALAHARVEVRIGGHEVRVSDALVSEVARVARVGAHLSSGSFLSFMHKVLIHERERAMRVPAYKDQSNLGVVVEPAFAEIVAPTYRQEVIDEDELINRTAYKNKSEVESDC